MLTWLKTYASTHIAYIAIGILAFVFWRAWITQHDNAIRAEMQVHISEADVKARDKTIADLQASKDQVVSDLQKQVQTLQARKVDTPAQALPFIKEVAPAIKPVPVMQDLEPTDDSQIKVDAVELAKTLKQCSIEHEQLDACQQVAKTDEQIIKEKDGQVADKDAEIKTLKKPQGFWKKVGSTLKAVAVGVGIGFAVAHY